MDRPELSIIIVSYNVCHLLLDCIQSVIDTTTGVDYEIIVVDNASADRSVDAVKELFPHIKVIANDRNVGFAQANNQGFDESEGDFLLLLNPDTAVKPGAIKCVLEFMKNTPDAGMAACRLLNGDGSLQKSIRPFPTIKEHLSRALFIERLLYRQFWKKTYYQSAPLEVDYCTGAFMMVRRAALGDMPLLSPEFFMYAEEKDLAFRLREKGWKTYFVPFGEITHLAEQSAHQVALQMFLELQRSQIKFFNRHSYGLHKDLLIWSHYLSLFTYFMGSLMLPFSSYGRYRIKLFMEAFKNYPRFVRSLNC